MSQRFSHYQPRMEVTPVCWILLMFGSRLAVSDGDTLATLTPNRSQFFEYNNVSVSCEVKGNSAGWRLKRNTTMHSESGVESLSSNGYNYFTNALKSSDSGEYWCESESGEHSNSVNITVHGGDVILESPALPVTEGHSVTLNCRYKKIPSDLTADFYKDGSHIRTEPTGVMTIPAVNKSYNGLYKCNNSQGESPESLMTVTDISPSASLIISPNRSQFFEYESVTLSCELQGNSTGWRLKRYTMTGQTSDCGTNWGMKQESSCNIHPTTSDNGVYWCESRSGEHSNTVKITVHGDVILESPALPVTEGHSVTLICRYKNTPSDLTADFYKDGSLIRAETTGEMTIPAVNMSDEGLYSCSHPERGRSPESWMTVTGNAGPPVSDTLDLKLIKDTLGVLIQKLDIVTENQKEILLHFRRMGGVGQGGPFEMDVAQSMDELVGFYTMLTELLEYKKRVMHNLANLAECSRRAMRAVATGHVGGPFVKQRERGTLKNNTLYLVIKLAITGCQAGLREKDVENLILEVLKHSPTHSKL